MSIMTANGWREIVCANLILPPRENSTTLLERWVAMARGEPVDDF